MGRVAMICKKLGLQEDVLCYLNSGDNFVWSDIFSQTNRQLLNLARALIANSEILCIHKPTAFFDEVRSRRIFKILHEFVEDKGMMQDSKTWCTRRPRTCIVTSSKICGVQMSDCIFHVSARGIRSLDKSEVSEDM